MIVLFSEQLAGGVGASVPVSADQFTEAHELLGLSRDAASPLINASGGDRMQIPRGPRCRSRLLVATQALGRGLDVPSIRYVTACFSMEDGKRQTPPDNGGD